MALPSRNRILSKKSESHKTLGKGLAVKLSATQGFYVAHHGFGFGFGVLTRIQLDIFVHVKGFCPGASTFGRGFG
jgi:hypothetical protein